MQAAYDRIAGCITIVMQAAIRPNQAPALHVLLDRVSRRSRRTKLNIDKTKSKVQQDAIASTIYIQRQNLAQSNIQ
jgi:hypothetical protein